MKRLILILASWDLVRWIRLALGGAVLYEGFKTYDWFIGILGLILVLQAVFNVGCCGVSGCSPSRSTSNVQSKDPGSEKIVYEEVK